VAAGLHRRLARDAMPDRVDHVRFSELVLQHLAPRVTRYPKATLCEQATGKPLRFAYRERLASTHTCQVSRW
jgi:hypothetical protein